MVITGLLAACATGGGAAPSTTGAVAGAADTTPPRLVPDRRFVPAYPKPLRQVGVQGSVDVGFNVLPSGAVDTSSVQVLHATVPMFAVGLRGSLAKLRLIPSRAAGHAIAGQLVVRITFRLASCDTTGNARRTAWDAEATPPTVTITQCFRPLMAGLFPGARKVAHARLRGLFSVSPDWESPNGFLICHGDHLPIPVPMTSPRGLAIDLRGITDWTRVDTLGGGRHQGDKYFIRWEGDIFGPPASGHLGIDRYEFRPTRIVEAARSSSRSCPL